MEWIEVAGTADFEHKNILQVEVDDEPVGIYKVGEKYYALHDVCSHAQAYLTEGGLVSEYEVECPLHGARFDIRDGRALCLPAVAPVEKFKVKIEDGRIFLGIEE